MPFFGVTDVDSNQMIAWRLFLPYKKTRNSSYSLVDWGTMGLLCALFKEHSSNDFFETGDCVVGDGGIKPD